MRKFVELIRRMHQERYSVVMNHIVNAKIPVAFLSVAPLNNAIAIVNDLRGQGVNVRNLVSTPPPQELHTDFNIIHLSNISEIQSHYKYILTVDLTSARVAVNRLPDATVLQIGNGYTDNLYDFFMNNLEEFRNVYEALTDEESRRTFYGYWLARISNSFGEFRFANTMQYILNGFIPQPGAVVIDCGACDGGTAARFAGMGYKVYGFEMDAKNFAIAKVTAENHGFVVENVGLGSYKHEMHYTHHEGNIGASRLDANGVDVTQIITLDSYIYEHRIPHVDFIKTDTEGAELDILRGATTVIARDKPILALSAYHKNDDFFTLMNFVKSVRPDYEFALRHYPSTIDDVPFIVSRQYQDSMVSLGLEPDWRYLGECVLFAR